MIIGISFLGRGYFMEMIFAIIFIIAFFALMFNAAIVLLEVIIPLWIVYKLLMLLAKGIKALIDNSRY